MSRREMVLGAPGCVVGRERNEGKRLLRPFQSPTKQEGTGLDVANTQGLEDWAGMRDG